MSSQSNESKARRNANDTRIFEGPPVTTIEGHHQVDFSAIDANENFSGKGPQILPELPRDIVSLFFHHDRSQTIRSITTTNTSHTNITFGPCLRPTTIDYFLL